MTTSAHYQLPAAADLYELWRQRYGYDAAALHLIMCLGEYQYRATEKGAYADDIAKIATITARLAQWAHEEGRPPSQAGTIVARMSLDDMETALSFAGWWLASPAEAESETCERMARVLRSKNWICVDPDGSHTDQLKKVVRILEAEGLFVAHDADHAAAILRNAGYTAYKVREASATIPGIPQTEEEVAAAEALIDECPLPVPPELVTPPDISRLMRPEAAAPEGHATLRPARAGCVRFATEQPCPIACMPHTLCQLTPALQTGAETVYEHCAHQLAVARGMRELHAGAEVLLREDLERHGIPAESEYELRKYELARKDPRFPVIQE